MFNVPPYAANEYEDEQPNDSLYPNITEDLPSTSRSIDSPAVVSQRGRLSGRRRIRKRVSSEADVRKMR